MGWDIFGGVCCVVQGRRRLGIMKRNGVELMRSWEERRRMLRRWPKRSRIILMRFLKEVNGGWSIKKRKRRNVSGAGA
jgi:hypothetical protein